ncbi:hypothetical protein NDU88_002556 [Pleurodeles waltl]|uniref:Uncharacterized protein n=1 Tax=Pleurodeles waltl TaxID=8319 RepID=A0AAV7UZ80_PLEWA|nr:hypothetical protein NDU88_002556 [Pleurodeles waltl]
MEWGGSVELEEGAVGVDQGGEQADTGVGVLSYLNKLQGNSMLFELYYKNFGDDYISSLKPSLILLVFEATRKCRVSGMFVVERMEWGGSVELEEGAVGVDQGGEQADTGVGVLSYLNKLQGNSMLFELYYKNFGDDYISSLKPSLILLVFEATRSE